MGFTNVVWEARSTEQLAHDLTEGPGPASVGEAGAAWVRVANEFAAVSADCDKIVAQLQTAWESEASTVVVRKLEALGRWLQAASLAAATNGQRAEEAAIANTVAVLAMPSVSEAVEAKAAQDMMASLAAYNGAILNGNFAEFDEAARAHQANAAAVMRQYEDAVTKLAQPWEQPLPEENSQGQTPKVDEAANAAGKGAGGAASGGAMGAAPMPLAAWTANAAKSSTDPKQLQRTAFSAGQVGAGMMGGGGGYAPMAGYGRSDHDREYESTRPPEALAGGGEPNAGLSHSGQSWLPPAQHGDSAFTVSSVSWGPNSAVFDELVVPDAPEPEEFEGRPQPTLEQISQGWVSPPVIGADGRAGR
jgi:PPE family